MTGKRVYEVLGDVNDKYITEAMEYKVKKKPIWLWKAAVAACLCIAILGGVFVRFNFSKKEVFSFDKVLTKGTMTFDQPTRQEYAYIPIGERIAIYYRAYYRPITFELDEEVLSDHLGEEYYKGEHYSWYRPEGWDTFGWMIGRRHDDGSYGLFYFKTFDIPEGETFSYGEVLETIYGVTSADGIASIEVSAVEDNNTDFGREIQEKVGSQIIADEEDISEFYRILKSTDYYGWGYAPSSFWDELVAKEQDYSRFEYSFTTSAVGAGGKVDSGETTYGNRQFIIHLSDGSMILIVRYSALFGGFYEFSGVVTKALADEDVSTLNLMFGIE